MTGSDFLLQAIASLHREISALLDRDLERLLAIKHKDDRIAELEAALAKLQTPAESGNAA